MSDIIIVTGQDCLDYVNKPLGLANIRGNWEDTFFISEYGATIRLASQLGEMYFNNTGGISTTTTLHQIPHDTNKRMAGVVLQNYSDGGKLVAILGNETLSLTQVNGYKVIMNTTTVVTHVLYHEPSYGNIVKQPGYLFYPEYSDSPVNVGSDFNGSRYWIIDEINRECYPFDDTLDLNPLWHLENFSDVGNEKVFGYQGSVLQPHSRDNFTLTTNPNNTLTYGESVITELGGLLYLYGSNDSKDPLDLIAGDIYGYTCGISTDCHSFAPNSFESQAELNQWTGNAGNITPYFNGICIPYNLVLTNSVQYAQEYVNNGVLPPDAYLYPLDFDNLPKHESPIPTGDQPDDYPDDNDPDDNSRDFDNTPNEVTSFTVNQLTNYNWYWLTVPQFSAFINWFWHDIGDYNDFDDIIAKIKGLYNDVASAVIMCRYYPVDYEWITNISIENAPTGNIKLGMLEKEGAVQMISQASSLRAKDIGKFAISRKYKSFMDLSPYSQLSLYLPWHGFVDLDINLFNGHAIGVRALYDYLSGTIQYYIFYLDKVSDDYDDGFLTNTILCKMAMDIPITLQTKNDRDSAIFNNVSSTIGGLVGAGAGILSGNPIGMALGVTQGVGAFNSANASAPMRLMGNVGETGGYIAPQHCYIVVRRPTIQPSDGSNTMEVKKNLSTWKKNVGMLCGYGYTLSDLARDNAGFTVCHSPRIDFKKTTPLQTEVDEIYDYLSKGVIL